jgi:ubiquitin-conjugating enzyme E2 O
MAINQAVRLAFLYTSSASGLICTQLDKSEAATRTRPPQFFSGPELSRLQLMRGQPDGKPRVGEKFVIRNPLYALACGVKPSVHGTEGVDGGLVTVVALMVKETRSRVTVLWQDGTREEHIDAKTLIPYLNIDEYDCWYVDASIHTSNNSELESDVSIGRETTFCIKPKIPSGLQSFNL